jgi:Protein of unknown function (DUF2975)
MSNSLASSPALPMAHGLLRVLVFLNWLVGAAILVLLVVSPHEEWILRAFKLTPSLESDRLVVALRVIALFGLICVPINRVILKRLLAMVDSAREGNPFVADNAQRLRTIAWCLLLLQLISMVIGEIAKSVSTSAHPVHLDAGFSFTGWLAVLLTFLLAGVFAEGTKMRDDLEGMV